MRKPRLDLHDVVLVFSVLLLGGVALPVRSTAAAESETASLTASDAESVYLTALRFYSPPRNQSRWLDARLLVSAGDSAPRGLDPDLARRLVTRLGRGFCLLDAPDACTRDTGAELRVSEIRSDGSGHYRVTVGCRLRMNGGGEMEIPGQEFVIIRSSRGWHILDRHGVKAS